MPAGTIEVHIVSDLDSDDEPLYTCQAPVWLGVAVLNQWCTLTTATNTLFCKVLGYHGDAVIVMVLWLMLHMHTCTLHIHYTYVTIAPTPYTHTHKTGFVHSSTTCTTCTH